MTKPMLMDWGTRLRGRGIERFIVEHGHWWKSTATAPLCQGSLKVLLKCSENFSEVIRFTWGKSAYRMRRVVRKSASPSRKREQRRRIGRILCPFSTLRFGGTVIAHHFVILEECSNGSATGFCDHHRLRVFVAKKWAARIEEETHERTSFESQA